MAHESPLRDQHLQAEAAIMPYGPPSLPVEVVESFGEVDFEYAAIRKACVLLDQPNRGTLEIAGDDRLAFLNNMLTQELKGLEPFRSRRALWLNRKGRIVADLRVTELGDRMLFDADVHAIDAAAESLESYVIADDVEIRDVTDRVHRIALHGPTAAMLLDAVCEQNESGDDGPLVSDLTGERGDGIACEATIGGVRCVLERNDLTGEIGVEITAAADEIARVYNRLVEAGCPMNGEGASSLPARVKLRPAGWLAVNTARIEAGSPLLFVDFSTESLPAEVGDTFLHDRVSFTKGCYLGQEVVARMHSLGKPKQVLVGLRPAGDTPRDSDGHPLQPLGGSAVTTAGDADAQIGVITSSTISPMLGGIPIAFAIVKAGEADDGREVDVVCEGTPTRFRVQRDLRFHAR